MNHEDVIKLSNELFLIHFTTTIIGVGIIYILEQILKELRKSKNNEPK